MQFYAYIYNKQTIKAQINENTELHKIVYIGSFSDLFNYQKNFSRTLIFVMPLFFGKKSKTDIQVSNNIAFNTWMNKLKNACEITFGPSQVTIISMA